MNKKDIIKLIIAGILALVLILLVINSRPALKKAQELRKKTLNAPELTLAGQGENNRQNLLPDNRGKSHVGRFTYKLLEEKSMNLVLKRDPFSSLPASIKNGVRSDTLSLSGILYDQDRPMAILDGEVVKIGQRVGSKVVREIKRDRVILSDGEVFSEVKLQR